VKHQRKKFRKGKRKSRKKDEDGLKKLKKLCCTKNRNGGRKIRKGEKDELSKYVSGGGSNKAAVEKKTYGRILVVNLKGSKEKPDESGNTQRGRTGNRSPLCAGGTVK